MSLIPTTMNLTHFNRKLFQVWTILGKQLEAEIGDIALSKVLGFVVKILNVWGSIIIMITTVLLMKTLMVLLVVNMAMTTKNVSMI